MPHKKKKKDGSSQKTAKVSKGPLGKNKFNRGQSKPTQSPKQVERAKRFAVDRAIEAQDRIDSATTKEGVLGPLSPSLSKGRIKTRADLISGINEGPVGTPAEIKEKRRAELETNAPPIDPSALRSEGFPGDPVLGPEQAPEVEQEKKGFFEDIRVTTPFGSIGPEIPKGAPRTDLLGPIVAPILLTASRAINPISASIKGLNPYGTSFPSPSTIRSQGAFIQRLAINQKNIGLTNNIVARTFSAPTQSTINKYLGIGIGAGILTSIGSNIYSSWLLGLWAGSETPEPLSIAALQAFDNGVFNDEWETYDEIAAARNDASQPFDKWDFMPFVNIKNIPAKLKGIHDAGQGLDKLSQEIRQLQLSGELSPKEISELQGTLLMTDFHALIRAEKYDEARELIVNELGDD